MKVSLLVILLVFASAAGRCQILNIDKNEVGEKDKKWLANLNLTLSSDQQKYNVLDIFFTGDVSYKHNARRYVFYGKIDRLTDGSQHIQDAGCFQLRDRIATKKKFSLDYFVQYQWNGSWGLVNRSLAGTNFIQQWVNNDSVDFFTGIGVFYEHEHWNYSGVSAEKIPVNPVDIDVEHPRLNLTAKYARTFMKKYDFVTRFYNQSTIYKSQFSCRTSLAFQLNLPLTRKVVLATNAEAVYDTQPVVPVHNLLYGFSQSITVVIN